MLPRKFGRLQGCATLPVKVQDVLRGLIFLRQTQVIALMCNMTEGMPAEIEPLMENKTLILNQKLLLFEQIVILQCKTCLQPPKLDRMKSH